MKLQTRNENQKRTKNSLSVLDNISPEWRLLAQLFFLSYSDWFQCSSISGPRVDRKGVTKFSPGLGET